MNHFINSTPEAEGIPGKAVKRLIEKLQEQKIPLHSLLIARHGKVAAEAYFWPYEKNTLHRMFSQTKSFTSLAIGLLEAEGRISIQDKICSYFSEYLPGQVHPWMEKMTIENLLMMETCHDMTTYKKASTTENWVRSFFQTIPTHRPGTIFQYDTSASHTLCALAEKLTGQKLLDYLKDKVLREIGFSEESYIIEDPFGVSMGGTGLMATPMDMMRIGLMLLNEGIHPDDYGKRDGRRVYPKEYLEKALSFQTPTAMSKDHDSGYGYQFWKLPGEGFAMLGMGSQNVFCFPKQDMVFVVTADTQGIPNGTEIILNNIYTEIFEHLSDQSIPSIEEERKELLAFLEDLKLPVLQGREGETLREQIDGKNFYLLPNKNGFKRFQVSFSGENKGVLEYENERGNHQIFFGLGHLESFIFPEYGQKSVASGAWCDRDTLYIRAWLTDEMVSSVHWKLVFSEDGSITVLMRKTDEIKLNEFQGILNG